MAAEDGDRDQVRERRGLVSSGLDLVQRLEPSLEVLLVLLVPLRDARVEIPAVVVEAWLPR